jgi:hypothetical protein
MHVKALASETVRTTPSMLAIAMAAYFGLSDTEEDTRRAKFVFIDGSI